MLNGVHAFQLFESVVLLGVVLFFANKKPA
jgi:hypothetical protein